MKTYLAVCGIVLHLAVLLIIIGGIISEIKTRRYHKKKTTDRARREARWEAAYQEDLKVAKQAWQKWAKKLGELRQDLEKATSQTKRMAIELKISNHHREVFVFSSCIKLAHLDNLGREHGWVLPEQPLQ